MKLKYILILFLTSSFISSTSLMAQTDADALRYSLYNRESTARAMGMGNSMGAIGADFSVASTNPAGLAWMRDSRFEFSTVYTLTEHSAKMAKVDDSRVKSTSDEQLRFKNIGFVSAATSPTSEVKALNFSIGYNTLSTLDGETRFEGTSLGSIVDRFQELANSQNTLDDFESGLAYDAEALYDSNGDGIYESDVALNPAAPIFKRQTIVEDGVMGEIVAGMSANLDNKILIGISLGFPQISYEQTKTYFEQDQNEEGQDVPFFEELTYVEKLETKGNGFNMKLGMIYRPTQALRLGLAFHTPTWLNMRDFPYTTDMSYTYSFVDEANNVQRKTVTAESPINDFDYKLRTPMRVIGSAAIVVGKKGMLTGEVEFVDYTRNKYNYRGYVEAEDQANDMIDNNLKSAINAGIGGELVATKRFRIRGGVNIRQSPIVGDDTVYSSYNLGFGIHGKSAFIDLGIRNSLFKSSYVPYRTFDAPEQIVDIDQDKVSVALTIGFKL